MTANDENETKLWKKGYNYVLGCDESGMGSLAGNVYVAVVIFPIGIDYKKLLPGINDSKKLTPGKRERLCPLIKKYAIDYSVQTASIEEIRIHNIYWARFIAARRAIEALNIKPDYVLMDGNAKIPEINIPQSTLVKGDTRSISIAAASILAKVDRDEYIEKLSHKVHDDYGWASNKAYYSEKHVNAIKKYGKTEWHRHKFVKKYLESYE